MGVVETTATLAGAFLCYYVADVFLRAGGPFLAKLLLPPQMSTLLARATALCQGVGRKAGWLKSSKIQALKMHKTDIFAILSTIKRFNVEIAHKKKNFFVGWSTTSIFPSSCFTRSLPPSISFGLHHDTMTAFASCSRAMSASDHGPSAALEPPQSQWHHAMPVPQFGMFGNGVMHLKVH